MERFPLISIIVPVYKVEAYLARCVDSLLAQTYENLEIILVDDGSPDHSGKICDDYAARHANIRVIHKENGGLSSARNAGIDVARGEYLGFVDSDDWVDVHTYEWLLEMALEEQVTLVCAGRYDYNSATGEKTLGLCPPRREVISGEELTKRIFLWDNADSAACDKLYHRSLFRDLRYPLGVISEDLPVTYRTALEAGRVGMLDKPVYYYFHRPGSITMSAISEKSFQPSENTRQILAHIRRELPALEDYATSFHVSHLGYICTVTELAEKPVRDRFKDQYRRKRAELRSFLPFILRSPLVKPKDRLTWITISLGCYPFLRKIYHIGRES